MKWVGVMVVMLFLTLVFMAVNHALAEEPCCSTQNIPCDCWFFYYNSDKVFCGNTTMTYDEWFEWCEED